MNGNSKSEHEFLERLSKIVEANLANDQFGVNELAAKTGLSRSQIHRRLKSICNKSVSQFIREVRLEKAKELLEDATLTSSEIAYKVGFGSPSYFIKSFHDYFGYPPGEGKKKKQNNPEPEKILSQPAKKKLFTSRRKLIFGIVVMIAFLFAYFVFNIFPIGSLAKKGDTGIEKSIIILPFKNLAPEKSDSIFSEGISIDIRNQLAKVTGLKVLPRTSAEQFRGSTHSSIEIARKVNVNYIMDGDVRRQGNNVRIHVELTDGAKNNILWSENYDRPTDDIFAIQSDIAVNVAHQLQSILSPEDIEQIKKLQPKNTEAYTNYLMGQYFCLKRDSVSIQKGLDYFEKAIEIDPDYTLAYSGLANAYYALSFTGNIERSTGYDKAYKMAEKALEKDSMLSEAYAVLGVVSYFGYWKWEEARKFFEKAIEVDSNCMVAHLYYCSFLDIAGEPENALKHANWAIELEPYFHMPYNMKGIIYRNEKKFTESTKAFQMSIELNPKYWTPHNYSFFNLLYLNDEATAVQLLYNLFSIHPNYQKHKNEVIIVYEKSGINGVLNLFLNATLEQGRPDNPFLIALLTNMLGMQNEAMASLERACRERKSDIPRMISIPEFQNLHSNPRFQVLVDTMNLRPYFPNASK